MPRLLTQAQYARKTKYSRARITQLVKQGVIVLKNGKVDPGQAEAAITANIDRSRQQRAERKAKIIQGRQMEFSGNGFNTEIKMDPQGNGFNTESHSGLPSLTEARRNRELIKIQYDLIELKEKKGELVDKTVVTEWLSFIIANAKSYLWGLPKSLSDALFIKLMKLLRDEISLLPPETQEILKPVVSKLRFDQKIIEQELRHSIRQVLQEMGTHLEKAEKGIKKKYVAIQ